MSRPQRSKPVEIADLLVDLKQLSKLDKIIQTLNGLKDQIGNIMSAISDFVTKQKTFNDAISAGIDDISDDIKGLNAKIDALQNSAGTITPEDQASLDELQAAGQALADRVKAVDELTPPTPPVP